MMAKTTEPEERRGEAGAALLVCLLLMAMLGLIGMASLETVAMDRRTGGFQSRSSIALYAAEAGVARAMRTLSESNLPAGAAALEGFLPAVATTPVGDASQHPGGAPTFAADDSVANPISYLGSGEPCEEWATSIEVGGPVYLYSLWDIRVQGETPDGAKKRLQASATRCYAYDG
jgi:hypothetical protein